jgi:hypothetical protein
MPRTAPTSFFCISGWQGARKAVLWIMGHTAPSPRQTGTQSKIEATANVTSFPIAAMRYSAVKWPNDQHEAQPVGGAGHTHWTECHMADDLILGAMSPAKTRGGTREPMLHLTSCTSQASRAGGILAVNSPRHHCFVAAAVA